MNAAIIPVVVIGGVSLAQLAVQQRLTSRNDYQCDHCGKTFSLSPFDGINQSAPLRRQQVRAMPSLRRPFVGLTGAEQGWAAL
jgi:hypothetical protein